MKSNSQFTNELAGKKILFANFSADGHFNPLTGLAVHLKNIGCDVRWYTSSIYSDKISKLQIPHYTLKKALDVTGENVDQVFPERTKIKGQIKKLTFDMINAFILRGPEYYYDIVDIHKEFPFDLMIADCAFAGIPFVKDKMGIPVITIGIMPLSGTSKDLPPAGLGMTPSYSWLGRAKQAVLRLAANKILFAKPNQVLHKMLDEYGIPHNHETVFDLLMKKSTLFLQSGTPQFEYFRSDMGKNIRFVGALLPYSSKKMSKPWFDERLTQYQQIVIVTQGTVERNVEKIIVPTLEAFKDSDILVLATTGGSGTAELKKRFPQKNLIIEDFIPFADIMPYADAYITNGGYGGVMLGFENRLPLVVAGVHEGKNEINARIGYFKLGVNLKTETPKPKQIKQAIEKVISDETYKANVVRLSKDFRNYDPAALCERYVLEVLQQSGRIFISNKKEEEIY